MYLLNDIKQKNRDNVIIVSRNRTMLSFIEFGHLTYSQEKLVDFLIQHGVLACTIKCSKCGNDINIDKETLKFRCRKLYYVKNIHKKRVSKQCDFIKSAKAGTWFVKKSS